MRRLLALAAVSLLVVAGAMAPASAQVVLSDDDAFVSFCIGVLEVSARKWERMAKTQLSCGGDKGCESRNQFVRDVADRKKQQLKRAREYVAKGRKEGRYSENALEAMQMSRNGGIQDEAQCLNVRARSHQEVDAFCGVCLQGDKHVESPQCTKCIDEHTPEVCKRIDRCDDTSRLKL